MRTYCFLSFLVYGWVLSWANSNSHPEAQLRNDLLPKDHHPLNRPVQNLTTVTVVNYDASLYQLVGFNSKDESIELLTFQRLTWRDEFLIWDPANYSGLEKIRFSQLQIWTPDVLPYNEIGDLDYDRFVLTVPILVNSSGHVIWSQPVNMETTCSMDVTNFPFDSQTCEIEFGSWQYDSTEVMMSCVNELDLNDYIPDTLWELQGTFECLFNGYY